jgi:general secretion pathway protein D
MIASMRLRAFIFLQVSLLCATGLHPATPTPGVSGTPGLAAEKPQSSVSKKDRQTAEREFKHALELQKSGQLEGALAAAAQAAELFPGNAGYVTAREMLRQQVSASYLDRGNVLAEKGDLAGAAVQFRQALAIDPQNTYLMQRLRDVSPTDDPERRRTLELLASVDTIDLAPWPGKASIHVRGDTRALYTQIGQAFKVTFQFDQAMNSRAVRFDLDDVDFYTATRLAAQMTKTFWSPVTRTEAMVASDTQEMRKVYERMSLRTLYIPNALSPADLTDVMNVLRTIFEVNQVSVDQAHNTITIRAPRETVEAAVGFIENLIIARPEILLDVEAMEFDANHASTFGLDLPTSLTLFSIPSELRRVLGSDAQSVIDQFNRTGTIDPSTIPATALANLQGSPLLSPFLFFGKGEGLTGFTVAPIAAHLALNSSRSTVLEHVTLHAREGADAATFRVGDRYPVLTGTFTGVTFSTRGAVSSTTSTPQFQYYDLGLTLKVKPHVLAQGDVRLDLEFELVGLGPATLNNIPSLTNRSFKGNITVKEGEPSVITGAVNDQELRSLSGYPAIGQLPLLRSIISTNSNQRTHNQILIVVTPRVVRYPIRDEGTGTIWGLSR